MKFDTELVWVDSSGRAVLSNCFLHGRSVFVPSMYSCPDTGTFTVVGGRMCTITGVAFIGNYIRLRVEFR